MNETLNVVRALKKTHESMTVGIGIAIGLVLVAYFYSFAVLLDRINPGIVTFQIVTTILFVICLAYLKRVAFFFTKLRYGKKQPYASALVHLNSHDLEQDESALAARLSPTKPGDL